MGIKNTMFFSNFGISHEFERTFFGIMGFNFQVYWYTTPLPNGRPRFMDNCYVESTTAQNSQLETLKINCIILQFSMQNYSILTRRK